MAPGTKTIGNKFFVSTKQKSDEPEETEEWRKEKQLPKPTSQLELSDGELKEIISKQLSTVNPLQPQNLVEFNYATSGFIPLSLRGNMVVVFDKQGTLLHKTSQEAKDQMIEMGIDPETYEMKEDEEDLDTQANLTGSEKDKATEENTTTDPPPVEEEADEEEGEGEEKIVDTKPKPPQGKSKKLVNLFNFSERAALTYNNTSRNQETQTTPPPLATFSGNVTQWVIYDSYQTDYANQQLRKELQRERKEKEKAPTQTKHGTIQKKKSDRSLLSEAVQGRALESWKVLERMINLNTYNDISKDYRYWDDPSDEFRIEEGTLLPLWKFIYERNNKHTITDMEWNPFYYDLFTVCFGFLDFMKPMSEGALCLFTIKNPSYPDYICITDSGVMCADTHPKYPYMVVVGLHDGSVLVYNIWNSCKEPAYRTSKVVNKHRGVISEIKWAPDLPDGELNFVSVSTDGKVNNWVLMQSDLSMTTIIQLYLDSDSVPGPDGTKFKLKGCASCLKLHPKNPFVYLVGTEEGLIYKCSTAYSSLYLLTYHAHELPIHRIDFNHFNDNIFISCSGDWRIKIWEDNRLEPLFVFDVGERVGDVKWAPYSSTVFAAVTMDGKVHVYDLNINKYKSMCVQAIVSKRKNKLTRISFNPKLPIIIVGDDKGCVTLLKLSPNLRIPCKATKKQQHLSQWNLQCMKLDRLLALVREPLTLSLPDDTAGTEES